MNKKQYNNIIENTLKYKQFAQSEDSLAIARAVFANMGVALPSGDIKTVCETIKTNDYMGWRECSAKEAQEAANGGFAAIGINEDKIVVISATDEDEPVAQTVSVMTLSENTSVLAIDGLKYYAYNYKATSSVGPYLLSIFSCANDSDNSSINTTGHAFLTIKNCTYTSIIVGGITVAPYEEISIGTWGNQKQHDGIWYNLESYLVNTNQAYQGRVSLTENITRADIDTINTLISKNDEWTYLDNCSSFATGIWNEISSVNLNAGFPKTPATLVKSIKSKSGYETNRSIQYNTNIGYVQNGNFVSVVSENNSRNVGVVQFIEQINLNPNSFEI